VGLQLLNSCATAISVKTQRLCLSLQTSRSVRVDSFPLDCAVPCAELVFCEETCFCRLQVAGGGCNSLRVFNVIDSIRPRNCCP